MSEGRLTLVRRASEGGDRAILTKISTGQILSTYYTTFGKISQVLFDIMKLTNTNKKR